MDSMYLPRPSRLWKSKGDFFRPFRASATDVLIANTVRSSSSKPSPNSLDNKEETRVLACLNGQLLTLVELFPEIEPAFFRDMLRSMSEESRVEVVAEQLLKGRTQRSGVTKLVKRKVVPLKTDNTDGGNKTSSARTCASNSLLDTEDCFRTACYHESVRSLLRQEFKSLSPSSIRAVMTQMNSSYTRSRPVLQHLTTRTWRFSLTGLWNRKATGFQLVEHPALEWEVSLPIDGQVPILKETGSQDLDMELHKLLIEPIIQRLRRECVVADHALAQKLNGEEAEANNATFDCECCYSAVPFEEIATCRFGDHFLCYDCITRTTIEALYGQGWARTVHHDLATIRCFAPAINECNAVIPKGCLEQALRQDLVKPRLWQDFQDRITSESLLKSRLPLHRCPDCQYAEAQARPSMAVRPISHTARLLDRQTRQLNLPLPEALILLLACILHTFEALIIAPLIIMWLFECVIKQAAEMIARSDYFPQLVRSNAKVSLQAIFLSAIDRTYRQHRGLRFTCRHPSCNQTSCLRCHAAPWRDPHVCFDSQRTSLRTALEDSATQAVKRTCPRCFLAFVKASGCNKMVCACGRFTMCYVCRAEIPQGGEGYAHFCQHFRPQGGRCVECEKCDLYGDEDEEAAIRKAVHAAEEAWRVRERKAGKAGEERTAAGEAMIEAVLEKTGGGLWYERVLDWWITERIVFVEC